MSQQPASAGAFQPGAPLYRAVRLHITEAIGAGEWRPGDALPAEKKLCERFGVSMGTLRKAVDELTASGLLVRQQGRGTFVARHSQDRYLFSFFHLVGHDGRKAYPTVRFLNFERMVADRFAAEALALKPGAPLLHLSNELSLDGTVVSLDEIYLPATLFPGLTEPRLRGRQTTLYQMYQDEFDVSVVRTAERLQSVAANRAQARLLKTTTGNPLLRIVRTAYSFQDRPVELRLSFVNTAHCEYRPETYVRDSG
jgi:GntR family transcriptional regulator